jgi:hypothetical protein
MLYCVDNEEKAPPLWFRICGMVAGAIFSAVGALFLGILGGISGVSRGGNLPLLIGSMAFVGACTGFALPKQTLGGLFLGLVE